MSLRPFALDGLRTSFLGRRAFRAERTPSTQDDLRALLDQGHPNGTLVWADHQTAGRGTRGRSWFSLPDPQLMVSFALRSDHLPGAWPLLNVGLGIAVAKTLRRLGLLQAGVKWPNDVTLDGRKVAGILSEIHSTQGQTFALVGLGLNHRGDPTSFPKEFRATSTILSEHLFPLPSIEMLLVEILSEVEEMLSQARSHPEVLQQDFATLWIHKNCPLRIDDGIHTHHGEAREIREDGALLLQTPSGLIPILSGTVRTNHPTN